MNKKTKYGGNIINTTNNYRESGIYDDEIDKNDDYKENDERFLEKNEDFIDRRLEIADIYNRELASCPHVTTPVKKRDHVYSQYIIKIDKNRDNFAKELKERGIYTSLHYIPMHLLSYYKQKYSLRVNDFPKALSNYQQILSLPIYSSLSDKDILHICEQIKEIAKNRV